MTGHHPEDGRKHFFDQPGNVRLVTGGLLLVCGIVAALDVVNLVQQWMGWNELRHAEGDLDGFPFFYAIYGFVACVLLVLAATQMRRVLMRDEDYYDD